MFRFVRNGEERGDCTAQYNIVLDKEYTVMEFIKAIKDTKEEWGYIGIKNKDEPFFGKPKCEYNRGVIFNSEFTTDVLLKTIASVKADGGWTRMDYLLVLENE